jgi:hypothetical protein
LVAALPLFGVLLAGPALAGNLAILTGAAAVLAVTVNVANVAMNAHGVAVEQRLGRRSYPACMPCTVLVGSPVPGWLPWPRDSEWDGPGIC